MLSPRGHPEDGRALLGFSLVWTLAWFVVPRGATLDNEELGPGIQKHGSEFGFTGWVTSSKVPNLSEFYTEQK